MANSLSRLVDFVLCSYSLGITPRDKWTIFWKETKNIRVRLGLEKHHSDKIYSLNTIYGRLYIRDNFGDITNLPNVFFRQVYGVKKLNRDGVVIDIGANIGLVAALIAYYNPGVQIHCFEPLADNVKLIKMNCPSARINQIALGAERSRITLEVDKNNVMASQIPQPQSTHKVIFEVISLDEYVTAEGISEVALIKLDAEGMELDILRGATKTLKQTRRVVMETHGYDLHETALSELQKANFIIESERFVGSTGMINSIKNQVDSL